MTTLRELANGMECQVRVPSVCNKRTDTTVLAHVRMIGFSGMSYKMPDWFAAWACSTCHDYVDGRSPSINSFDERRQLLLEGMVRTQYELLKRGHLPEALRTQQQTTENT